MAVTNDNRSEIVFFDVETTVPTRPGQGFAILEFGAILVCPKKLEELRSYSTLVRPADLSHISSLSVRCNGITKEAVVSAPSFEDIADVVYDLLNGRIWAGHNILRFDCARVREAFAEIKRPPPEPRGTIDSLALLTQKFGRRAGDMKMASLATYFGIGPQTHRSLDDVRMNLEVLKYCATVLFLESSLPEIFTENSWVSPNATTRSRANGKSPIGQTGPNECTPPSIVKMKSNPSSPPTHHIPEENHQTPLPHMTPERNGIHLPQVECSPAIPDPFSGMSTLCNILETESNSEDSMDEEKTESTPADTSVMVSYEQPFGFDGFLGTSEILVSAVTVKLVDFYRGAKKIQIVYQDSLLQLQCLRLKVRFGISTKFMDHAGRPRLSIVVDAPVSLCNVLDEVDNLAKKLSIESSSTSEWRPVVSRKPGFYNTPTVRLHLPTITDGENTRWITEIYQEKNSTAEKMEFSRFDVAKLESLFTPGDILDVCLALDTYDYQQNAGIRLVAKKLMVHFR